MSATMVSLAGCTIGYRKFPVLTGVSLEVEAGEIAAIIGPNGAGKTALLKTVAGILPPLDGALRFAIESPIIGYVPQSGRFDPVFPLSVLDVVEMGAYPQSGRRARGRAVEALERVGLRETETRSFFELSGGQKQRVLIARALVRNPSILLLDEPTAGIDPGAERAVIDLLRSVNQERGVTIVMVSHHLRALKGFAGSVIVVHAGGVAKGAASELLSPAHVEELFGYLG